jgi:hypothetical protein
MCGCGGTHSVEDMHSLFVAITLAASVQVPAAATAAPCEFFYLRDNAGYSVCHTLGDYAHRAAGSCSWYGPGDPTGISEYAATGPWVDPTSTSPVSCPKFYYLIADVETR